MSVFTLIAVLGTSQPAEASIVYALSLSGDLTGSGAIVFQDGAFDVDGVHDLDDVLVSFDLTVDGMSAKDDLRATPPITFTTDSLLWPEMLQYEVQDKTLKAIDFVAAAIMVVAAVEVAIAHVQHKIEENTAAQKFEDGAFAFRVDSSTLPFFRCDPRVEDCRATLSATAVPEPSSALLLFVMMSCLMAFAGWRGLAREKI